MTSSPTMISARSKPDERPDWKVMTNEQREDALRRLAAKDYSSEAIAAHFQNCSRNAVIGKIRRMEVRSGPIARPRKQPKASSAPAPANLVAPSKALPMRAHDTIAFGILPAEKNGAFEPLPGIQPLPILELPNRSRCRWPIDIPQSGQQFACGAATASDTHVYCAPHRMLSSGRSNQGAE